MIKPRRSIPPLAHARNHSKKLSRQQELELLQKISDKLDYLLLRDDEELRFPHHEHYLETLLTPE